MTKLDRMAAAPAGVGRGHRGEAVVWDCAWVGAS